MPFHYTPEDVVLEQDGEGTHFYFIAQGICDVIVKDYQGVQKI